MSISIGNPLLRKLEIYILKKFTRNFLIFSGIIFLSIYLVEFVELIRRTSENPDIKSTYYVLYLSTLKLSGSVFETIPILIFLTTLSTCFWLNRNKEMVIIQNTGINSYRILYPCVIFSIILGLFYLMILNPVLSYGINSYEKIEQELFRGKLSTSTISKSGVWLRQGSEKNKIVIRASNFIASKSLFEDVTFYIFTKRNNFIERIDSKKAELKEEYWLMEDATINRPNKKVVNIAEYTISTNLSINKIESSFLDPNSMSIWKLPGFIELLKQSGFSTVKHQIYLYKAYFLPFFLVGLVFLAGPFTMKFTKKKGRTAYLILMAIITFFFIYVLSEYIYSLGIANKLPAWLASISPSIITILLGNYFVIHFENEN